MKDFQRFDPQTEFLAQCLLAVVNAVPAFKHVPLKLLGDRGINVDEIVPGQWMKVEVAISLLRHIRENIGSAVLFGVGKAIIDAAFFPEDVTINSFEQGLQSINEAYYLNHRYGKLGHYRLLGVDYKKRKAVMESSSIYPDDFDRGMITAMARKFKPADGIAIEVKVDESQPYRATGGEATTFLIAW